MTKPKRVESIEKLDKMLSRGIHEYFILLAGGFARSSKNIYKVKKLYEVMNEIDGTTDELTRAEISDPREFPKAVSNIGFAIKYGAFYAY